jgi:hypothetical protein
VVKKNNKAAEARRRAKSLKRRSAKKAAMKRNPIPGRNSAASAITAFHQDPSGYLWWLAAGMNFLSSDYDEGVWDPPFPGAHKDDPPNSADMLEWLHKTHWNEASNTFKTRKGRALFGWFFMGPEGVYGIVQKILRETKLHNEDPRAAACGHAWKIFNEVGGHVDSKLGDKHMEAPDASDT